MKKLCLLVLIVAAALLTAACSAFNEDYVVIEDYPPAEQMEVSAKDGVIVRNIASLKQTIRTFITNGESDGIILFDMAYDGDPVSDMSKACWQVRTQDALCAYCVEDISFELNKIVTYYEAKLTISYTDYVNSSGSIIHLPYSAGIEMIIKKALTEAATKLVLLVDHSSYSAEELAALVGDVYRQNPATAPREPFVSVNLYSGSNYQRLYEINMVYGLSRDELLERKKQLDAFAPFADLDFTDLDETQKAFAAYQYLCEHCRYDSSGGKSTVYDALIGGCADSEGMALGYVELCRQLEIDCRVVYGQHDWQEHCWNIIRADNRYSHVDTAFGTGDEGDCCFMQTDEAFWESYRWDMSSYPACGAEIEPSPEPDATKASSTEVEDELQTENDREEPQEEAAVSSEPSEQR